MQNAKVEGLDFEQEQQNAWNYKKKTAQNPNIPPINTTNNKKVL